MSRDERYSNVSTIKYGTVWEEGYVDEENPDSHYEAATQSRTGTHGTKDPGYFEYWGLAWMKYLSIPQDATISSATLYIYIAGIVGTPDAASWETERLPDEWDEDNVTWNNCPTPTTPTTAFDGPAEAPIWLPIGITDLVQDAVTSRGGFLNLVIKNPVQLNSQTYFIYNNHRYATTSLRPYMLVTWTNSQAEEAFVWTQ